MMMVSLVLNIAILLLLVLTLGAGYRLHKRLHAFRIEREEFEPLVHALDNASNRAETVLSDFRQVTESVSTKLTAEAEQTQRLIDELDFMTKRADQLADTLERAISGARHQEEKQSQPLAESAAVADHQAEVQTLAPQEQRRRAPDLEKRLKNLR